MRKGQYPLYLLMEKGDLNHPTNEIYMILIIVARIAWTHNQLFSLKITSLQFKFKLSFYILKFRKKTIRNILN